MKTQKNQQDYDDLAKIMGYQVPDTSSTAIKFAHNDSPEDAEIVDKGFDPSDVKTKRRFSQKPLVRVGFVASGIVLAILIGGLGLNAFFAPMKDANPDQEEVAEEEQETSEYTLKFDDNDQKDQEIGEMKSKVALQEQQAELDNIVGLDNLANREPQVLVEPEGDSNPKVEQTTSAPPQPPPPVPVQRTARPVPPPPVQRRPIPVSAPVPRPASTALATADIPTPQEQWLAASQFGIIGYVPPMTSGVSPLPSSIYPPNTVTVSNTIASRAIDRPSFNTANSNAISTASTSSSTPVPPPPPAPISTVPASNPTASASNQTSTNRTGNTFRNYYAGNVHTPGLTRPVRRQIAIGTTADASIVSPVAWPGEGTNVPPARAENSPKYVAQLDENLLDTEGEVVVPKGTQLIIGLLPLDPETGVTGLDVLGMIRDGSLYGIEPYSMTLRGKNGQVLVAERMGGNGSLGRDLGLFAISALEEVGRVTNRFDNQTITSTNFSESINVENGAANYLGAVLEGGAGALADRIEERDDRRIEETRDQPDTWVLDAGTKLQLFVNREIEI